MYTNEQGQDQEKKRFIKRTDFIKDMTSFFKNEEILYKLEDLVSFKCNKCLDKFKNLQDLKKHLKLGHSHKFCEICLKEKKEFVNSLEVFSDKDYKNHVKNSHEECLFCKINFYDLDLLFQHLKKEHEICFVCKKLVEKDLYFQNYLELEKHFQKEHHLCEEEECLEKKFIVFENEIELKSHYLQQHSCKTLKKKFTKLDFAFTISQNSNGQGSSLETSQIRKKIPKEFGNRLTSSSSLQESSSQDLTSDIQEKLIIQEKDIILEGIYEKDFLKNISDLLSRDAQKYSEFISIYEAFKGRLVSGHDFLKVFMDLTLGSSMKEFERLYKTLSDLTPSFTVKKNRKKGIPLDLSEKTGNPEMLKAWNDYKIKNSNQISHWENVDTTWASNARLKTLGGNSGNRLLLSRSNVSSKPVTSQSSNTWVNRPISTGDSLEDFPSLPTPSRPVSSGARGVGSSEPIEWKKKGKKKVLMHFG